MPLPSGIVISVAVVLGAGLAACGPKNDVITFINPDDAKMNAAISQARQTLPIFWAKVDEHDPAISDVQVKVGLPDTHNSLEYIWMTVESHSGLAVRGRLANEPVDLPNRHNGDEISVETSKISDWAYTKAGKQYGEFTVRVMADTAKPAERRELEQTLAASPLEPSVH